MLAGSLYCTVVSPPTSSLVFRWITVDVAVFVSPGKQYRGVVARLQYWSFVAEFVITVPCFVGNFRAAFTLRVWALLAAMVATVQRT